MSDRPLVSIVNVEKHFGSFHALKQVSLDVRAGEVLCIIGASGSGKTTLLRCINQLVHTDSGAIWVDGDLTGHRVKGHNLHPLSEAEIARQRLSTGMVFQRFNLFPHMTALENIVEGPVQVQGRPRRECEAEAARCWNASGWRTRPMRTPPISPAASSSASPSPAPWR
jgi:polar amino acid transport system ATP-binding protein